MGQCKVRGVQDGTPKCDVEDGFIGVSARAARDTGRGIHIASSTPSSEDPLLG